MLSNHFLLLSQYCIGLQGIIPQIELSSLVNSCQMAFEVLVVFQKLFSQVVIGLSVWIYKSYTVHHSEAII